MTNPYGMTLQHTHVICNNGLGEHFRMRFYEETKRKKNDRDLKPLNVQIVNNVFGIYIVKRKPGRGLCRSQSRPRFAACLKK